MEVRYIEIKTSPAGQIIRAYTPEQYKKEMARRKNATARARKLTRLQERVGAVLAMLGFLMYGNAGELIFYDSALIAPIADTVKTSDYIQTVVRKTAGGAPYVVIKDGFEVLAGFVPVKIIRFVVELLEANGITVTPEINAFIEAAVKELDLAEKNAIGEIGKIFSDAEQTPQN